MKAEKPEAENLSPKAGLGCSLSSWMMIGDVKWNGWQCWGFYSHRIWTQLLLFTVTRIHWRGCNPSGYQQALLKSELRLPTTQRAKPKLLNYTTAVHVIVLAWPNVYRFVADIILAVSFWYSDQPTYSILTLLLVLLPNAIVQIFSARWNKIDEVFSWPVAILHGLLLGTLHRWAVGMSLRPVTHSLCSLSFFFKTIFYLFPSWLHS